MRKKIISPVILLLTCFCCGAQTVGYKYTASLPVISKTGFYNIPITPELSQHLKIDYTDLRIINDSGRWVPHVAHKNAEDSNAVKSRKPYLFRTGENSNKQTVLFITHTGQPVSNIVVTLKNTSAQRIVSLSGSDDEQHWFVINDSLVADPLPDASVSTGSFRIDFPPVTYKFFRLIVHNNGKDPFDIKALSNADAAPAKTVFVNFFENPPASIMQKDSAGRSYIRVVQNASFHFSKIGIKISASSYFRRLATLYLPTEQGSSFAAPGRPHESFYISNDAVPEFNFPRVTARVFYIVIDNADSPPLKAETVTTFNAYEFITAFLEEGKTYRLMMDNEFSTAPRYDLDAVLNAHADSAVFIDAGTITAIKPLQVKDEKKKSNRLLLWTAISAALFLLLFISMKMVKELNNKKEDDRL